MPSSLALNMDNSVSNHLISSMWPSYTLQQPSLPPNQLSFPSNYHSVAMPYGDTAEPSGERYRLRNIFSPTHVPKLTQDGVAPTLYTNQASPSLKRPFSQTEIFSFSDNAPETKDEHPKISQDHQLMSFTGIPEKHTILDNQGRVSRVSLSAQLHGMFFLSELAMTAGETQRSKPELTCYRRNLFQISGGVTMSRGALSYLTDRGEQIPLLSMEIGISATESVDGNLVKLIVIPWKTPPLNSPEIASGPEREPAAIPIPLQHEGSDSCSETVIFPFAFRRLQFRIATANNGRRRELQQHFALHLKIVGTLANGSKVDLCESSTAPIVVRGRSPRNFQARKEIPLMGSSSSRGNPPELQIAMNSLNAKAENKTKRTLIEQGIGQNFRIPGAPFTFESSGAVDSICLPSSYPSWEGSIASDRQSVHRKYPLKPITLDRYFHEQSPVHTDVYRTASSLGSTSLGSESPASAKFSYQNYKILTPSRVHNHKQNFIFDDNPRSIKSPRLAAPNEQNTLASFIETDCYFSHPFDNASTFQSFRNDEKYVDPTKSIPWTTDVETTALYDFASPFPIIQPLDPSENFGEESRHVELHQQHYHWDTHNGDLRHGLLT